MATELFSTRMFTVTTSSAKVRSSNWISQREPVLGNDFGKPERYELQTPMSKFELDEFVDDRYKTMSDRLAVR